MICYKCRNFNFRWLTLENNKLSALPHEFTNMKSLLHLNLNKNNFKRIPNVLIELKKLRYLLLQNNELFTLNIYTLNNMKHVHKINLMHNPITTSLDVIKVYVQ